MWIQEKILRFGTWIGPQTSHSATTLSTTQSLSCTCSSNSSLPRAAKANNGVVFENITKWIYRSEVSRRKSASPWSSRRAPCPMAFIRKEIRSYPAHFDAKPDDSFPLRNQSMATVSFNKPANSSSLTCSSSKISLGQSILIVEVVDMGSGYTIFAWAQVCCGSRSAGGDGNFECWMVAKCSSRSVGVSPTRLEREAVGRGRPALPWMRMRCRGCASKGMPLVASWSGGLKPPWLAMTAFRPSSCGLKAASAIHGCQEAATPCDLRSCDSSP